MLLVLWLVIQSVMHFMSQPREEFIQNLKLHAEQSERIHLERYHPNDGDLMIDSVVIPKADFLTWVDELPGQSGRLRISNTRCWVPHHQIRFYADTPQASIGWEPKVEICFSCDEIMGRARSHIPKDWLQPLRKLFTDKGIPIEPPSGAEREKRMKEWMSGGE